jgi:hypothetical protein
LCNGLWVLKKECARIDLRLRVLLLHEYFFVGCYT